MTTMNFALSAALPGYTPLKPWDFNWTLPVSAVEVYTLNFSEVNGVPKLLNVTSPWSLTGIVYVPATSDPDLYTQYGLWVGTGNVNVNSFLISDGMGQSDTEQSIAMGSEWSSIKDIRISDISVQVLDVSNFVDTWIDAPGDSAAHVVNIDSAKRGSVSLGDGNDSVRVGVAANEYSWPSHFSITVGNGNDTVDVKPEAYSVLGDLNAPAGWMFNRAPQLTTADVTLGDGNDTVSLAEVSGTIHVGGGNDTINITDGNTTVWLGRGSDVVKVAAPVGRGPPAWAYDTQAGSCIVHAGSGHADITIDDTVPARTPRTTLQFMHGETGGDTLATADVVRYGHYDLSTSSFVGGDLGAVAIDLTGYSPGSTASLTAVAAGSAMLLQVHDAATGRVDAVALYGAVTTNAGLLNLWFS